MKQWKALFVWEKVTVQRKNGPAEIHRIMAKPEVAEWLEEYAPEIRHGYRVATGDDPPDPAFAVTLHRYQQSRSSGWMEPIPKVRQLEFKDPRMAVQFKLTFL
jgi:hypothetical protein